MAIRMLASILFLIMGQPPGDGAHPGSLRPAVPPPVQNEAPQVPMNRPSEPDPTEPDLCHWLVNLARHQGHLFGRQDPRSASLHVMSLLRAATHGSPRCADAFYWLYDLEQRMGRREAARETLATYVQLRPGDDSGRLQLLELEIQDRQTAEARVKFVKEALKNKPLSRMFESELHRWLAAHYYERQETTFAASELELSLRLNPMNVRARELAYTMFGETEPALQRVEMALQLIGINPSQANLVWDLGEYLDSLSLHQHAQEWYQRAIDLHLRANAAPVPPEFRHRLAVSYVNSGDDARAKEACDEALKVDESLSTTRLLRAHVLTRLGKTESAAQDIDHVAAHYQKEGRTAIQQQDFDTLAEIAWFYCYHRPDAERAIEYAAQAMKDPDPSLLAKVAFGFALRLNGRTDEAMDVLKPLSEVDQLAAYELARAQIERGNKAGGLTTLHKAATMQYSGIAYDAVCRLLQRHGETPPLPPLNRKVIAALDKFKRDVFDYHRHPKRFLKCTMQFAEEPLPQVGPIELTFRVENIGPFPITFGEGFMARPLVSLTATLGRQLSVTYKNYLQVLMNARPTLLPGDAVSQTVAIDVGPVRRHLLESVLQPLPIEITAMFDPVYDRGRLTAGLGTIILEPIRGLRRKLDTSPEGIMAIQGLVKSPQINDRMLAADQIGALLASIKNEPDTSSASAVPIESLHTTLAELLTDEAWQVRAHAVDAAGWSPLDTRVTVTAAPLVRSDQPVVRLLAVRLFAEQHGEKFKNVLEQLSRSDPSPFVRMMAMSYLPHATSALADERASLEP